MDNEFKSDLNSSEAITKAIENVKVNLALSSETLEEIIGVDPNSAAPITNDSQYFECVELLIRVYRSIYAMTGGNGEAMRHWLNTPNYDFLDQAPIDRMKCRAGLVEAVNYLDGFPGRN